LITGCRDPHPKVRERLALEVGAGEALRAADVNRVSVEALFGKDSVRARHNFLENALEP
jgi:hypothetical protein